MSEAKHTPPSHDFPATTSNDGSAPIRVQNFAAGRNLAVAMLQEAQELSRTDKAMIRHADRTDTTQLRFVQRYLPAVQADPKLLDGFTAVLSDRLAGTAFDHDVYASLRLRDVISGPGHEQ